MESDLDLAGDAFASLPSASIERQENGWWLVRFPGIPEALTEGETEEEARANALDCVVAALEGYTKAGRPLP